MYFTSSALVAFFLAAEYGAAFTAAPSAGFVTSRASTGASPTVNIVLHHNGCDCSACARRSSPTTNVALNQRGCDCPGCARRSFVLFAETTAEVPPEVEALDGVNSEDEAHNVDRPARKSLKKKGPRGKPLSEFNVGDTVSARVKALASYGAFLDIGAQTDGLLHISQLSVGYVANVNDVLKVGQELEVRITSIDEKKNQVALSLLSQEEEDVSQSRQRDRAPRQQQQSQQRRDDSAVLAQLGSKGWDTSKFVEGTVVSTVDFGAFVRIDASQLNSEVEGDMDGLVHISALSLGRVDSVKAVVNVDDKVQVRVKDISGGKVSLTMVSAEDETAKAESQGTAQVGEGNKSWSDDFKRIKTAMPEFKNRPMVVDRRN